MEPAREPPLPARVEQVRALQQLLTWLGLEPGQVDGWFGPLTTQAVKRFQQAHDLPVDGVVGPLTAKSLVAKAKRPPGPSRVDQVRALQRLLERLGFEPGRIDGWFGPLTTEAVLRFQQAHELPADGVVGPLTAKALIELNPEVPQSSLNR